jgi:hypothetical protein
MIFVWVIDTLLQLSALATSAALLARRNELANSTSTCTSFGSSGSSGSSGSFNPYNVFGGFTLTGLALNATSLVVGVATSIYYLVGRDLTSVEDHAERTERTEMRPSPGDCKRYQKEYSHLQKRESKSLKVVLILVGAVGLLSTTTAAFSLVVSVVMLPGVHWATSADLDASMTTAHAALWLTVAALACKIFETMLGHYWAVRRTQCMRNIIKGNDADHQ